MARALDIISIALLAVGIAAMALGVHALGENRDLQALYWLVVGGLVLRTATDLLRPKSR